jgi:hypothetical protein
VGSLEEKFDEAIDTSEKKFEIVDNQLQVISSYLNKDRQGKDELLRTKREELAAREQEIAESFQMAEKQRFEIEKKLSKVVEERALSVQADI